MKLTEMLEDVGRPVAYYPSIAKCLGGVKQAIFVCEFAYWTGKGADPDGWIYKTQADIENETGLSDEEQLSARRSLKRQEIIEEKLTGCPAKLYYRLNKDKLNDAWENREAFLAARRVENQHRTLKARETKRNQAQSKTTNKVPVIQEAGTLSDRKQDACVTGNIPNIQVTTTSTTHTSAPDGAVCDEFLTCENCGSTKVKPHNGRLDIGTCEKCSKKGRMVGLVSAPPKSSNPKSRTSYRAPTPDEQAVIDEYTALYVMKRVAKPGLVPNDYKAVKELVEKHGRDAVIAALPAFLALNDERIKDCAWHLFMLPYRWSGLTGKDAPPEVVIDASHALPSALDKFFGRTV